MKTLFLFFVLLGCVYTETCPPLENVEGCTCETKDNGDILVECNALTLEELKDVLNSLSGKKNIDLIVVALQEDSVPSNFFNGCGIRRLRISHSFVSRFSEDGRPGFVGLENTLEELMFHGSLREENILVKLQLGHLKRLKELDLLSNSITELSDGWFDGGPASLEYLTMSNNLIQKVGSRAFGNLTNLKRLIFENNRFGPLKRSMFPNPALKLGLLKLDDNALTHIPEDLFSNMPVLNIVSFQENGIFRLDQKTWQPVWRQLDIIHLESNTIECDTHMKWIFSLRMTSAIYGTCGHPEDLKGVELQAFIDHESVPNRGF